MCFISYSMQSATQPFLVSSRNALRDDTKNGCVADYIACTLIDFVFKSLKSALHVFHCSIGYSVGTAHHANYKILQNSKLTDQYESRQRQSTISETDPVVVCASYRDSRREKKTGERREPTVDVHSSGKQVGTPQLKFYSTANSLAGSKHSPILKQSDFT